MSRLKTFHDVPCIVAFEAHRENVLVFPREKLARLRDESALRLRQYADDLGHDARLRRRAGEDLESLGKELRNECERFRGRIDQAEQLLSGPMSDILGGGEGTEVAGTAGDGGSVDNASQKNKRKKAGGGASASSCSATGDGGGSGVGDDDDSRQQCLWVTPNDPPISYSTDFRGELVETIFNVSQAWTFSFGSWYYRLKRWLYNQPRWRRVYRLTQIESLSVSQELLMGVLNAVEQVTVYPGHDTVVSDLEVAACLLAAYQAALDPRAAVPTTVEGVLRDSGRVLRALSDDIAAEIARRPSGGNAFAYKDPPGLRFYAPVQQGRRYAAGTFDENALVAVLLRRGAIAQVPGGATGVAAAASGGPGSSAAAAVASREVMSRLSGAVSDDVLALWTLRLFGKRLSGVVPNLLQEQHYLRSGLTAVLCLLFLWKLLNSESVFSGRAGKFSLRDVFPDLCGGRDAPPPVEREEGFAGGCVKNFEFMMERYVVPWYSRDPAVTVSQLWPGLVLLLYCESHRSGWDLSRRPFEHATADGVSSAAGVLHVQASRFNPLVDYMLLQQTAAPDKDVDRLAAHDFALFHCENGIGRLLSITLPKHRVLTLGQQFFNLQNVYDSMYFFVLGFLPVVSVT
ncbi:pyruvoyl decarboxylase-like protein [Murid betaherpesvirus 1]|uniref:Pyruvoyl decarboxylase-like protein n=3 Tax=Muromegalovirus muridbeta1 TaxID=3050323 RepID=D3XDQ5_MUHVS